jgi:hypothetical protein
MHKHLLIAACACLLAACSGTTEPDSGPFQPNPLNPGPEVKSEETPIDERIASLLQESKQQYDEGHFEMSFKMAQQVEALILEHRFPVEDQVMALTIQGYCMLQMGYVDDYYVSTHGVLDGAVSKFKKGLKERPDDFRCKLGIGLALFRRHGESIKKAELLGEGVIALESIREDFRRGLKGDKLLLKEADRKLRLFKTNSEQFHKLKYIFTDPTSVPLDKPEIKPAWLGELTDAESTLAIHDLMWISEDAVDGDVLAESTPKLFDDTTANLANSWRKVRSYWRLQALSDLQNSRDRLLEVREMDTRIAEDTGRMVFFWVDRDLTFVFQSLGAFFLDSALEKARLLAIAEGTPSDRLEIRARQIFLDKNFTNTDKTHSLDNYRAALEYTESFVRKHKQFEKLRLLKSAEAEPDKDNSNPFMVDLVRRYQGVMFDLIAEERAVRRQMVLEAAVLCIEPLFQIKDIEKANSWANEMKAMDPNDPIHHFVRATAYFTVDDFKAALPEYEAFMQRSSITEDESRRSIARTRIMQCEKRISRKAGAGEDKEE